MKNKMKHILILVCAFTMIVSNSIMVFANNNTYTFSYTDKKDYVYNYTIVTDKDNIALVVHSEENWCYSICFYENGQVYRYDPSNGNCTSVYYEKRYLYDSTDVKKYSSIPYIVLEDIKIETLSNIAVYDSEQAYIEYCTGGTAEEPSTEPSTEEQPTTPPSSEEPSTGEQPTTPPSSEEPPTENIDYGIAGNLVSDLIGNTKEFTPQSVMAIFVVCLVLECLSHIASALLSVGGMK